RNHGPEKTGTIGFLKSTNRVNVALTRARQGLFVFGNGDLLSSKSDMWSKVTEYFKELDSYGTALPIACHMHPDTVQWVNTAEQLRQVSPDDPVKIDWRAVIHVLRNVTQMILHIDLFAAMSLAAALAKKGTHAIGFAGKTVGNVDSQFQSST
ncbi:hypothetical protein FRC18_001012, partial [Serendipita sp. 400]